MLFFLCTTSATLWDVIQTVETSSDFRLSLNIHLIFAIQVLCCMWLDRTGKRWWWSVAQVWAVSKKCLLTCGHKMLHHPYSVDRESVMHCSLFSIMTSQLQHTKQTDHSSDFTLKPKKAVPPDGVELRDAFDIFWFSNRVTHSVVFSVTLVLCRQSGFNSYSCCINVSVCPICAL